jgi:hypothetical protein
VFFFKDIIIYMGNDYLPDAIHVTPCFSSKTLLFTWEMIIYQMRFMSRRVFRHSMSLRCSLLSTTRRVTPGARRISAAISGQLSPYTI